jgi:hypothetical protein
VIPAAVHDEAVPVLRDLAVDHEDGEEDAFDFCRVCGCTDGTAYVTGVPWPEPGLCSECAEEREGEPVLEPASLALFGPWWSAPSEYAPNDDTAIAVKLGPRSAR